MIRILLSTELGKRKWTQAQLARKTKIRPSTINDYYHELTDRVNLRHLDAICKALGCSLSDILVFEADDDPRGESATEACIHTRELHKK